MAPVFRSTHSKRVLMVTLLLSAALAAICSTAFGATKLSPKAALEHDVTISKSSGHFLTATAALARRPRLLRAVVTTHYNLAANEVVENLHDGHRDAIWVKDGEYGWLQDANDPQKHCWLYTKKAGAAKDASAVRFDGLGGVHSRATVTETAVDYRDGARSRFVMTIPGVTANSVDTVLAGKRGRILFDDTQPENEDKPALNIAFTYPTSEPHRALPKANCTKAD